MDASFGQHVVCGHGLEFELGYLKIDMTLPTAAYAVAGLVRCAHPFARGLNPVVPQMLELPRLFFRLNPPGLHLCADWLLLLPSKAAR
jgi:hypothetical protein